MAKTPHCPLCKLEDCDPLPVPVREGIYYLCGRCDLRFLDPAARLDPKTEHERYMMHENDASNPGYVKFLEPLLHALKPQLPVGARGLDFGCGPNSVIKEIFEACGFAMEVYDPFFFADPAKLKQQYDFVTATEVAEHFYDPASEFARLRTLLKPGGHLGLMTLLVKESIDFTNWFYRRDPTHVVFYSTQTFKWIADQFGFEQTYCDEQRVVTLRRPL